MKAISQKSRLATLLLALIVGMLGAHRLYVGKLGSASAQILLTLSGFGIIITFVWLLVDILSILLGTFEDNEGLLVRKW